MAITPEEAIRNTEEGITPNFNGTLEGSIDFALSTQYGLHEGMFVIGLPYLCSPSQFEVDSVKEEYEAAGWNVEIYEDHQYGDSLIFTPSE